MTHTLETRRFASEGSFLGVKMASMIFWLSELLNNSTKALTDLLRCGGLSIEMRSEPVTGVLGVELDLCVRTSG